MAPLQIPHVEEARVPQRTLEETLEWCLKGTGQVKHTLQTVEIA